MLNSATPLILTKISRIKFFHPKKTNDQYVFILLAFKSQAIKPESTIEVLSIFSNNPPRETHARASRVDGFRI
jgi:hypothetical protein